MKTPRKVSEKVERDAKGIPTFGICRFCNKRSRISSLGVVNHLKCIRREEAKERKTEPTFTVSLQLDKTLLEGKGATVLEALRAIPKPVKITTKSVITVTKGDKTHSRALTIPLAKRLFYPAAQIYHAKHLELLMK